MIIQANTEHINGIVGFYLKHLPGPKNLRKPKSEALKSDVTVIRGPVSWSRDKPVEKAENDLVKRSIKIPTAPQFLILT